jgi:hypothetical protein
MTPAQAKAIRAHLQTAQTMLSKSKAAAQTYIDALHDLEQRLDPYDAKHWDGDAVQAELDLRKMRPKLEILTAVQPVSAKGTETMPPRAKPALIPGVTDALAEICKAGELLTDLIPGNVGNAST